MATKEPATVAEAEGSSGSKDEANAFKMTGNKYFKGKFVLVSTRVLRRRLAGAADTARRAHTPSPGLSQGDRVLHQSH